MALLRRAGVLRQAARLVSLRHFANPKPYSTSPSSSVAGADDDDADRDLPPHLLQIMDRRIASLEQRHSSLLAQSSSSSSSTGSSGWIQTNRELSQLAPAMQLVEALRAKQREIRQLQSIADDPGEEKDMRRMASEELNDAVREERQVLNSLFRSMLPKDEADRRDCILEVRAGTGGEEASLFAMDIFRMYERYSQKNGWKFDVIQIMESELKGFKEASGAISGAGAYGKLKFESGIHRVQRVPVTEKAGRVHTSAVSVAILPQADEVDVQVRNEDLRIDTYRAGGCGGQSVNTTNSAVRVTHIPSGIIVAIQDERSQHMNKAKALKVLRSRLYEIERARLHMDRSRLRSEQIGSGDRSERIRTYNFPQGRVTDHRVGVTQHSIEDVLAGESLDVFIDALLLREEMDAIASFASEKN